MLNSVGYQLLRCDLMNNDYNQKELIKDIMRSYSNNNVKTTMVDIYNKSYQLNGTGLVEYLEKTIPKIHLYAILNCYFDVKD